MAARGVPRLATLVKSLLEDARERGNLHCETMVRVTTDYLVHLVADEPERARETLRTAMRNWTQSSYQVQHYRDSAAQLRLALYVGAKQHALSIVRARRFLLRRSGLMRVLALRIESRYWDGLVELEAAPRGDRSASSRGRQARAGAGAREGPLGRGAARHAAPGGGGLEAGEPRGDAPLPVGGGGGGARARHGSA